jgi:NAD(P)-dependent dehydrogenase (short-subunit alcohol dehydrogenase family)
MEGERPFPDWERRLPRECVSIYAHTSPSYEGRTIMNEFQGKVAIVTGGTSGIGRAAAIAYAREGAKVVVAGRRAAEGEETVKLIHAQGGEAIFVPTDVSKATQVKELVDRTMQKFGRLDFAFNNAGIEQQPTPFLEQDEETYDRVMDINVKGVWLSMRHEIPAMLKTGGGSIVNTSSGLGVIGLPGIEIYVASKHAVIGLTKSAALEFGKQGIRVNAILPAVIDTEMFQRFAGENPEFRAQMTALHPIGRIGKSEEIADAAIWLSSSKSSFVTGHSLLVDGGFTAQ